MKKTAKMFAGLVAVLTSCLTAGSAHAVNNQSWVSSTGGGTACTRAAPCATFAAAHDATTPDGVISVLDGGDFGGVNITKSLTIRADGVDAGATTLPGTANWIIVEAGTADVVTLEGLRFNGLSGVDFRSGGQLHVVGCVLINGRSASNAGVKFRPNSASKLTVTDTVIQSMGSGTTGGGIIINPQAGGSAQVALERVALNGNTFGLLVDGTNSTAGINVTIADSMIANNVQGSIRAFTPAGGAPMGVLVKNTKTTASAIGIQSVGPNVTVRLDGSSVTGHGTGLSFSSGGALLTFGNNNIVTNGSNGAFTGSVALQ